MNDRPGNDYIRPLNAPTTVLHKGTWCNFDMVAPITGDLIYTGQATKSTIIHVILPKIQR